MVKKTKALSTPDDRQLAEAVRTSAQQIWQAGLGAFAKAQEEGGKAFATLVKEGTDLQKRTKKLAQGKVSEVTDAVTRVADSVDRQASGSWDKLEQVFEDRVARSLNRLGVPTQKDIQALIRRVEELNQAVAMLGGEKAPALKPAAAKKATAKKAAKRTVPKAAAVKSGAKKPATKKTVARTSSSDTPTQE